MPLETATFLDDLDADNPLPSDQKAQGDDHIRLIKAVLLATFPNFGQALNITPSQLNGLMNHKQGTWKPDDIRAAVGDLNSQTEGGWYSFTTAANGNTPGMDGFLLQLSTDGDLATPQGGRVVMQVAFTRWQSTFGQNFAGNIGGVSTRVNVGGGWTPWSPDFNDTDPIGTSEMFWTTNFGLARGSIIDNPLRLHGMGEPVAPGAFFAATGTWYVVCGAGRVVQTFPGPQNWYNYIARRVR